MKHNNGIKQTETEEEERDSYNDMNVQLQILGKNPFVVRWFQQTFEDTITTWQFATCTTEIQVKELQN